VVKLVGFASLPADTFAEGPPAGEGIAANGRMGPFPGQPVQGFSGVQLATGDSFWFLSDNGFGAQDNSADYLLRAYRVDPDFAGSEDGDADVEIIEFVQFSDPNDLIPFEIVNEDTAARNLTGADFDIESFVFDANGDIWVGDEFGPFILHFDRNGILQEAPIATPSLVDLDTLNGQDPLVIAHRGASGDFPEHTIEAYQAAIAAGADFVEPDLAITSDGVLIARHEPPLAQVEVDAAGNIVRDADGNPVVLQNSTLTTNVPDLPQFSDRVTVKNLDGALVGGWFAEDFTLEEIKQIRAVQSRAGRDPSFDGLFEIPTFQEVIEAVQEVEFETGVQVGIYPETKHPTFFDEQGLSLEEPLVQTLLDTGFTDPDRLFIQSFEIANLLDLEEQLEAAGIGEIPLVQLFGDTEGDFINAGGGGFSVPFDVVANSDLSEADREAIYGDLTEFIDFENPTYGDLTSQAAIDAISSYASGLGPWKNNILLREPLSTPVDGDGDGNAQITSQLTGEIFPLIDRAHEAGLQVHPYTLRDEEPNLTLNPSEEAGIEVGNVRRLVNDRDGVERPPGITTNSTLASTTGTFQDILFDLDITADDFSLNPETGGISSTSLELLLAPELAAALDVDELAGTQVGLARTEYLLAPGEEAGQFVIVGGNEASVTSVFLETAFLSQVGIDVFDLGGTVAPNPGDIDTTELTGFGLPIAPESTSTFAIGPDGSAQPLGGLFLHEGEVAFEPLGTVQTPEQEVVDLVDLGVDGFFTDFPRTADPVRDRLVAEEVRSPQNPDFDFENTLNGQPPLIIAHRGASGDLPEHTLEAYRLAIYQGADFVEPDLAITSDGVLIARHEPTLAQVEVDAAGNIVRDAEGNPVVLQNSTLTTNVPDLPQFSDRVTVKNLDGALVGGWFAEDFTLEEIKQIRAVQSRVGRSDAFDGLFEIPTLEEVIALVEEVSPFAGRDIGIYPETKHPTFFDEQGLSLEEPLVQTLLDTGFTDPDRLFVQSFEIANLLDLEEQLDAAGIGEIPLVQLFGDTEGDFINAGGGGFSVPFDVVANGDLSEAEREAIYGDLTEFIDFENPTYGDLANAEAIAEIADYAGGLGPWKNNILIREAIADPADGNGDGVAEITTQLTGEVFPLIDFAHDAGLQIHPYTLRDEESNLTLNADGTPQTPGDEFRQLFDLGVDGVFTDFTRTGRTVLEGLIPDGVEEPNLPQSRGYEGMAFSPDRTTAYPMLEGTVFGDPEGTVRIYEFDLTTGTFADELVGLYPLDEPNHAIGDFTPINDSEFLVIERDGGQGEAAEFKKVFAIDFAEVNDEGFIAKEEVVDLLAIDDPDDLNGDGETTFDFPFVTIEDVVVLDERTILVANDNNYPFSVGRGPDIDNNEIVQLELDEPLDLDPSLGIAGTGAPPVNLVFGSSSDDSLDSALPDVEGNNALVFAGGGNDLIDNTTGSNSRLHTGSGTNEVFTGTGDRIIGGDDADTISTVTGGGMNRVYARGGDDLLELGSGDRALGQDGDDRLFFLGSGTVGTGGAGADQFWIANAELPESANTVTDFIPGEDVLGVAGIGVGEFADLSLSGDADTTIAALGSDLATLLGVTPDELSAADFAFA